MTDQRFVVGLGEVLWDKFSDGGKRLGGAPANFAYHAAQFGHEGLVVSAIGRDPDGDDIVAELEAHGLPYHLDRVDYPTGTVDVNLRNPDKPVYTINTKAAWSYIPLTEELLQIAARTKAVCFGSLAQFNGESRGSIDSFLSATGDCLKIFDINLRQRYHRDRWIRQSLHRADILKINDEELAYVTRKWGYKQGSERSLCRRLMKYYELRMVILTKGVNGSWVFWKGGSSFLPTPKVDVVSAVGAGDAFTGAFIGSYLNGAPIPEAHAVAVKVSAWVCEHEGAMPVYPPRPID